MQHGRVNTTTIPLVPRTKLPISCQEQGCICELVPDNRGSVDIVHQIGDERSILHVPSAWVADVKRDIWGDDALPWLKRLHGESSA